MLLEKPGHKMPQWQAASRVRGGAPAAPPPPRGARAPPPPQAPATTPTSRPALRKPVLPAPLPHWAALRSVTSFPLVGRKTAAGGALRSRPAHLTLADRWSAADLPEPEPGPGRSTGARAGSPPRVIIGRPLHAKHHRAASRRRHHDD